MPATIYPRNCEEFTRKIRASAPDDPAKVARVSLMNIGKLFAEEATRWTVRSQLLFLYSTRSLMSKDAQQTGKYDFQWDASGRFHEARI